MDNDTDVRCLLERDTQFRDSVGKMISNMLLRSDDFDRMPRQQLQGVLSRARTAVQEARDRAVSQVPGITRT